MKNDDLIKLKEKTTLSKDWIENTNAIPTDIALLVNKDGKLMVSIATLIVKL